MMLTPATAASNTAALGANPIRKIVTLMQNMQKEIEAEGEKEKELFDKFMCYCSSNNGELTKAVADAKAQVEELTAKLKSEEAEKAQVAQELIDHKKDRESAKADVEEATVLREKEANDRRDTLAFLDQSSGEYTAGAGEIVGILKAMKDSMEASLKEAIADEDKAVAGFADLKASKEKEVEMATEAIETKTVRAGELAVSVVQTKDGAEDAAAEAAETEKFIATLESQCATKEKEWAERSKARATEVEAISEAISILNDDDALDVFKKAVPSALVQGEVGFLQRADGKASRAHKAQAILASVANKYKSTPLKLLLYSMNSRLKLKSLGGFDEVMKMIDEMVVLLGKQQKEDDKQKTWCEDELEKATDEEAAVKTKLAQVEASISEQSDAISTLMEEISALTAGIAELDKAVADATEQRKEEHADYVEMMQMSEAAMGLVEKAKNRLQKFYNPTLYKAPPKKEMSMEEKIMQAGSFVQIRRSDLDVAPPPPPETFESGPPKKNEKSAGVIGLMDMIIKDLGNDMKDAEYEEKTAQKDYAELMADSQASRAGDTKSLTGKQSSKAEIEGKLMTSKETRAATAQDLKLAGTTIQDLHASCDFILQNYDLRKDHARTKWSLSRMRRRSWPVQASASEQ